ncbi:MFS transporter [Gordonia spumicola]|uniref:Multidrug efflux pump Tap n=1 Tax=Gordonia spumicola TaxID=589161 RepID=A0A7I9VEX5_9ACTN|nr:MFS transporter [Gordonia spumicola]GEE03874.1 MFS transporter [Gordonia spumicola]
MTLFAIRDYRLLFAAQVIALFGTGLATVALGLLAYDLAGSNAAAVLATALTIKMVLYVVIAPIAAAYVDRLPRRAFLVGLDVMRMGVVVVLPFVTQVWQVYVLVGLLQAASAAFTPTFQAVIPDVVADEDDFTRALSASQVVGGVRTFARTRELRGVLALNFTVASAGSIVVVDTVNLVRDDLGGTQTTVAWMLAASGLGTLVVALVLPRVLDLLDSERPVMLFGASVLVAATVTTAVLAVTDTASTPLIATVWSAIGAGMAAIVTPTGRVIRRVTPAVDLPAAFAAQFSLSHAAWLLAYPIAGWVATSAGLDVAWPILATASLIGAVAAMVVWPAPDAHAAPARPSIDDEVLHAAACTCARVA